jgi:CheY-like chemotaxis protein
MATGRILLVDDDLCFLYVLRFVLEAESVKTEKATNGADAVAVLDRMDSDLIITDFNMPGMNGVELAKIARKRFPHIPIIMITGEIGQDIVEMGGKAGISRILYKPLNLEKLLATIRSDWMLRSKPCANADASAAAP